MYGLIGYPLGHSFSRNYFTEKFKKEDINESYHLFPIDNIDLFLSVLEENKDLKGLNVTIPYKKDVISFLDETSEDVKHIGAVNVIRIYRDRDGKVVKLKGFNSDWIGFRDSLIPLLHRDVKSALVLGSGGASKAIVFALGKLGIKSKIVSRHSGDDRLVYEQLSEKIIKDNLLIVNTTPLGMFPSVNTYPDIPYHYLTKDHICYDLVYNPEVTEFMKLSHKYGATVKNGLEMLYLQADEAWNIWNS